MDYWLSYRWIQLDRPDIRYISIDWINFTDESPDYQELKKFRTTYDLPEEGSCPLTKLICFINTGFGDKRKGGNHYCCVVWDPEQQHVHVLGSKSRNRVEVNSWETSSWEDWDGPQIWNKLAELHGWVPTNLTVVNVDWKQNGYDCGPIACQVIEHIWTQGFNLTAFNIWNRPSFPCCHTIRVRIAKDNHLRALAAYRSFRDSELAER